MAPCNSIPLLPLHLGLVGTHEGETQQLFGPPGVIVLGACVHLITHPWNGYVPWSGSSRPNATQRLLDQQRQQHPDASTLQVNASAIRQTQEAAKQEESCLELVLAGSIARTVAQAVIHPLDTIKTRLQVSSASKELRLWQQGFRAACKHVQTHGLHMALVKTACAGMPRLYLGLTGAVLTCLPATAVFFATSQACKHFLNINTGPDRRESVIQLAASASASCTSALVRVPGDVLKHRVQAFMYGNVFEAARHVFQTSGLKGLYCGFGATLVRDVPELTIQFTLYEALRKSIASMTGSSDSQASPLVMGGLAGAVAAVATTPVDVIKCQLQCQGTGSCNTWEAIRTVMQTRGPSGFTAGMAPRVVQTALCSAVFFAVFETLRAHMRHQRAAMAAVVAPPQASVPLLMNVAQPLET